SVNLNLKRKRNIRLTQHRGRSKSAFKLPKGLNSRRGPIRHISAFLCQINTDMYLVILEHVGPAVSSLGAWEQSPTFLFNIGGYKSGTSVTIQQSDKMPSLGYLLLLSLAVALISPSSGLSYGRPPCPTVVNSCQNLNPCRSDSQCGSTGSCCSSGCGLRCINKFFSFFENLFSCGGGPCGQSNSGCSSGRCGQSSGQYGQASGQYGQYGGQFGGFFGKKKK
ncbi:unnamed protein product, partial [Ranitomeya imitator]